MSSRSSNRTGPGARALLRRTAFPRAATALVAFAALAGSVSTQSKSLRVCGDPENLPYSNERLEGYENKIAQVIATDLGAVPVYAWWPHQRGLVRNTIDAGTCDVIFGIPQGLDRVLWTKPYYTTSYVIAYRKGSSYRLESLDSPDLKRLRIGVYNNTPVEESLARRGLIDHTSSYSLFFDPRGDRDRPGKLMDDLVSGAVDVALPWGPLAGYYRKKLNAPLEIVPLHDETGVPLVFNVSMGVKKGNGDLKTQLEAAIEHRRAEIQSILEDFGVPLLPAHQQAGGSQPQNPEQEPKAGAAQPQPSPPQPPAPPESAAQTPPDTGGATPPFKKLNPYTGNAEMIAVGKTLYFQVGCQGCHGGGGGGGMAASLIDDSWKFGSDDETLFKLIKGRIPEQTMPTVYSTLPDEQVWQLLAFIRSLYKGDPSKINW